MQSFKEIRFPEDISYGSSGGPGYSTDIITITSGHEQRNINWSEARCKYNITHGVKDQNQLDRLISFFRIMRGRAYGFRFKDWSDYICINQIVARGDGFKSKFQLVKVYNIDGIYYIRLIQKPIKETVKIYINNIQKFDWELDDVVGIISFNQAVEKGQIITADFEFDVPVRFDSDNISAVIDHYGVYSMHNISLIEIKL